MHNFMNDFDKTLIEQDLKAFTFRNFEGPLECKNSEQARFYVEELCQKIYELEQRFNYVPSWAYALVAQYQARQKALIYVQLKGTY